MKREREKNKVLSSRRYPLFFSTKKTDTAIIIGCGDGPQIEVFSKLVKELWAVDIDDERIRLSKELVKEKGIKNCHIRKASIYDLESLGKRFDCAILVDVIEHLDNPRKGLIQTKKILKEKGRVLITFPNVYELYYVLGRSLNKYILKIPEKKGKDYDYHLTKQAFWRWFRLFQQSGFKIVKYNGTTIVPPLDWFGIFPFWFENNIVGKMDSILCKVFPFKILSVSMMVELEKR